MNWIIQGNYIRPDHPKWRYYDIHLDQLKTEEQINGWCRHLSQKIWGDAVTIENFRRRLAKRKGGSSK